MARGDKGVTTKNEDKGTFIPIEKRKPDDPENLRLSKAQYLEKQRLGKEKRLKLAQIEKQIEKEQREGKK